MEQVFALWHVYTTRSGRHEEKLLGIYTSKRRAEAVRRRVLGQPGFRRWPKGFEIIGIYLDDPKLAGEPGGSQDWKTTRRRHPRPAQT